MKKNRNKLLGIKRSEKLFFWNGMLGDFFWGLTAKSITLIP